MSKPEGLLRLVEEGVIDAVHSRLMSGKEATVYVVERGGTLGAAKVYKARNDRTFKNVASYVEGRNQTRNSRDRRAMDKKTAYGRELMEEGWQDMEFRALQAAYGAGVRVPEPFFLYEEVLFMELVVDADGAPASRLADFPFTPDEATALHFEVFHQVKRLLSSGQVHGDLSAYNILMAAAGPTIIDLPQVVDVSKNANAGQILRRDLRNITEHLARFDARLLRFADCGAALFEHFSRGTLELAQAPEVSAPSQLRPGRRGRDAERGRAGRDKSPRPDLVRLADSSRQEGRRIDAPRPEGRHGNGPRVDVRRSEGPRVDVRRPEARPVDGRLPDAKRAEGAGIEPPRRRRRRR